MVLRSSIVAVLGALIALSGAGWGASGIESKAREVDALFDCVAGKDAPGAAVLVAQNGKVLLSKAYGLANVELRVPNTPQTKFRLASITKSLTAAAVLQLCEAGKLSLDDPVGKYLPEQPHGDQITIRHLLTHTSGLRSVEKDPLEFAPGERLNYSNSGYHVLGRLIEKVSGQKYEDYLRDHIFAPLGMQGSGMDHYAPIVANRACGYERDGGTGYTNALPGDMSDTFSGGGLYATVEDLYEFDQGLLSGQILRPATVAAVFAPVKLNDGSEAPYGLGWMLGKYRGLHEASHGGDGTGCNAWSSYFPEQGLIVIVLSNVGMRPAGPLPNAVDLAHRIAGIYLGDQMEPEEKLVEVAVDPKVLARYTGVYKLEGRREVLEVSGDTITFRVEGGRLVGLTKMPKIALYAKSETSFFLPNEYNMRVDFSPDAEGRVTGVVIHLMGMVELQGKRVAD